MSTLDRFVFYLDRVLTFILLVLVVMMVVSITMEIVLNAGVQPLANFFLSRLESAEASQSSFLVRTLESVMHWVARLSSPVNTSSQTLLVWIGILGSALAFRHRAHLGVDALVRLYPYKVRLYLDYASTILIGLFSIVVLIIGGYLNITRAFKSGSKMPGFEAFNLGWFYFVLIITGVINVIYCVYHFRHPQPVETHTHQDKESDSE